MDSKEALGQRIKAIRVKRNETLEEFAKSIKKQTDSKLKTNKSNVSKWEKGLNVPNDITLNAIAELGNVTTLYLLEGKYMARDIHMMPEAEQRIIFEDHRKQMEQHNAQLMRSIEHNLEEIDLNNISINEAWLLYHFTNFLKNYRDLDDNKYINNMFATFNQLNRLIAIVNEKETTKEEKEEAIDFCTNDLIEENSNMYTELALFLKNSLK